MESIPSKKVVRKKLLARREQIPEKVYLQKSQLICDRLKAVPAFQQAHTVHCYISMNERREVNTHPLLQQMLATSKNVVVPVTQIADGTLRHIALQDFEQLKANRWGVLEPPTGKEVAVDALELVVVPMVGGDLQKNRIGYGKGFYDRFLQQTNCLKIGLLFEHCLMDYLPIESFDVPLDLLITEQQIVD